MAGKLVSESIDAFEYMWFERDAEHLKSVICNTHHISPWIDFNALKLGHRIGRGPFGDVWLSTHHQCTEDYERYHEVAVKMIYIKDDQLQKIQAKFNEVFAKCQGLENVCFLHGVSIKNGRICIVMRFYEGSVGDKMARIKGGKLSLSDVLRYGAELAQGILELHSRGLLVLNLKPGNILLDEHDRAILGDFGIPFLLLESSLSNPDLVHRLGTPNYMAPEQWQPDIRGPISYETDSWGFGCSILEMLTGSQPWHGKSPDEIYHMVVTKQEKPPMLCGLPPKVENVLWGCFEHDLRNRPLMADILDVFRSCKNVISEDEGSLASSWSELASRSSRFSFTDWSLSKDHLQVGDTVRSKNPNNSRKPEAMMIPEGTVVRIELEAEPNRFVLVKIHGLHGPLKVHSSSLERVAFGFASGDWVRSISEDEKNRSPIGILHSIDHKGNVAVGFVGLETLWRGKYSDIQISEPYCVGQFLRLKANISRPRFEWLENRGGGWATGRVSRIYPNGCLVVRFPGRFSTGKGEEGFLADPSEVEVVKFSNCEGFVKKYQHLEDFHWLVRPLVVALGLFAAFKFGIFVGKRVKRSRRNKCSSVPVREQQQEAQIDSNPHWLPPTVANILFREGGVAPGR